MLIAVFLALAAQQDCPAAPTGMPTENPEPVQRAGSGLWIGGIGFTPEDIAAAEPELQEMTGQWGVTVRFTSAGQARFQQAQRCGVGRMIEVSIDRRVLSRPILNEPIIGDRITLSGGLSADEAQAIAQAISRR